MAQKIAGAVGEAFEAFANSRRGKPAPPVIEVQPRPEIQRRPVTYNRNLDHLNIPEPETREQRRARAKRINAANDRVEAEARRQDKRKPERVSRPFKAKKSQYCILCHRWFKAGTIIQRTDPAGYAHEDCSAPRRIKSKRSQKRTAFRREVSEAIASSKYSPRH